MESFDQIDAIDVGQIAYYAAANAVAITDEKDGGLYWAALGANGENPHDLIVSLTRFVRYNPTAAAEALYRYAGGQGIHAGDPDGFEALSLKHRLAYGVFVAAVPVIDGLVAAERGRLAAAVRASTGPVYAAALSAPIEDTILAPSISPLDLNPTFAPPPAPPPALMPADEAPADTVAGGDGTDTVAGGDGTDTLADGDGTDTSFGNNGMYMAAGSDATAPKPAAAARRKG